MLKVGDDMVGGIMAPPMEGIPNHWHVYFAVEDIDAAVDKARQLGGTVVNGPFADPDRPDGGRQRPAGRHVQPVRAHRQPAYAGRRRRPASPSTGLRGDDRNRA